MCNKIYIVSFNSIDYTGGLENVVKNHILNYSHKTKNIITVLSRERAKSLDMLSIDQHIIDSRNNNFIDKIFFVNQVLFSFKSAFFILKNIKKYKKVIIHVHGIEYSGMFILLNLYFKHCYLIITAHGSLFLERFNYIKSKSLYLLIFFPLLIPSLVYDFIVSIGSYRIICINTALKKYFSKYSSKIRIDVIYNGMNFIKTRDKSIINSDKRLYNAVIVGSTAFLKGLPFAIKLINEFNNASKNKKIKLYIVGFKDFYEHKFNSQTNKKYFKYVGVVTQSELFSIYKKMDLMILPSLYEGFPLTVLESLNFKLPFIVSKACNTGEINHHEMYGVIVNNYCLNEWLFQMNELIKNINMYKLNIQKADFTDFKWDIVSKKNEIIYLDIIGTNANHN